MVNLSSLTDIAADNDVNKFQNKFLMDSQALTLFFPVTMTKVQNSLVPCLHIKWNLFNLTEL